MGKTILILFYHSINNNTRSERKRKPKNLIGNKTLRSYNSFKYEEINSVNYEDKVYSNYKYLRDNLQEIKPKNKNKRKKGKKDNNNSNFYDKTFNFTKPPNFEEIENHWNYAKLLLDYNILDFTSKFKISIYFRFFSCEIKICFFIYIIIFKFNYIIFINI